METPTPLEEALDYIEERNWDLVEVTPGDIDKDSRALVRVNPGGEQEMLVEIGWGAAGLYADIRFYFRDQPVEAMVLQPGDGVTVYAGTQITPL